MIRDGITNNSADRCTVGAYPQWMTPSAICFKDGARIVCRNICGKEEKSAPDLWIGYGSDGKWYYSTFHFCVKMMVLSTEEQPDSIAAFARDYYVHEFTGKSDFRFEETWPDPKWGSTKY